MDSRTDKRHQLKPKMVKFSEAMKEQAVRWLTIKKWSPELISFKGKEMGNCPIGHEWLKPYRSC